MDQISPYQNFPSIQSMIRNIHSGVWKLQAQNSKIGLKWTKFRQSMAKNSPQQIFSKRTIRTTSIPKIRKIHSSIWKLQAKNLQNCQFWPKIFSKKTTRVVSIPKIMRIYSGVWKIGQKHSKMAILAKNGQVLTVFGHF